MDRTPGVSRQEARRGRRRAYARLDPARTALIVIDMVPFFVEANPYVRGIVPNIGRIAEALRTAGGLTARTRLSTDDDALEKGR